MNLFHEVIQESSTDVARALHSTSISSSSATTAAALIGEIIDEL
jgi:hypothetical protein